MAALPMAAETVFDRLTEKPPSGRRGAFRSGLRRMLETEYAKVKARRDEGYSWNEIAERLAKEGYKLANGRKPTGPALASLWARVEQARRLQGVPSVQAPQQVPRPVPRSVFNQTRPKGEG
jgi:hypothetical protein